MARLKLDMQYKLAEARKIAESVIKDCEPSFRNICRQADIIVGDSWRAEGDRIKALAMYRHAVDRRIFKKQDDTLDGLRKGNYAQTVESYLHNRRWRWALNKLSEWENEFPGERIAGYTGFLKARAWMRMKKQMRAIRELEILIRVNPESNHASALLFFLAECAIERGDLEKGKSALEQLLKEYPESPQCGDAENLREKVNQKKSEEK